MKENTLFSSKYSKYIAIGFGLYIIIYLIDHADRFWEGVRAGLGL